jgi:hypothetical protein
VAAIRWNRSHPLLCGFYIDYSRFAVPSLTVRIDLRFDGFDHFRLGLVDRKQALDYYAQKDAA